MLDIRCKSRYNGKVEFFSRLFDKRKSTFPISKLEGGKSIMAEIRVKENESLDSALRRFKRSCAKAGVISEVRKREHYEKPSVRRKKKSEAARKRKFR